MNILRIASACACLALTIQPATAGEPAPAAPGDASRAERLFVEGVQATERGDVAGACAKFAASLELVTRASTLLNLATCETEQGKLASAYRHYRQGMALLPPGDERLKTATQQLDALAPRVPRLSVALSADTPATARVFCDEREVSREELSSLRLDPGSHTLLVAVSGRRDRKWTVMLAEGESKTITLAPGAMLERPRPQATAPPDRTLRTVGFAVGAVGLAGAIGAAVTGGLIVANDATIDEHCPNGLCDSDGIDKKEESEMLIIGNYVSWGLAIAGIGAGTALVVYDAVVNGDGAEPSVSLRLVLAGDAGLGIAGGF